AWFLRIVRNTCWAWHSRTSQAPTDPFDEERHSAAWPVRNPEALALHSDGAGFIARALNDLPDRFRELLVLRELQGLSYRELADAMRMPIGTVMSSLSRARRALRSALDTELQRRGILASELWEAHS